MRVLELTAHVQTVRRADSQSATAAAAYRSCSRIVCQRTGAIHDYTRKGGMEAAGIVAPDGAAPWAKDRGQLWNAAELKERNGPRGPNAHKFRMAAVVAREFMFGFPSELSDAGRLTVAQRVAAHLVNRFGVAADYAIHRPGGEGDQRNFHCHLMVTTRRVEADGLGRKTRELDAHANGPREVRSFREYLAGALNDALAAEGHAGSVFVEHRSFKARGSAQRPTRHQGKSKTNARRKDRKQAREAWHASERSGQSDRQGRETAALSARHQDAAAAKSRDITERESTGVAAIRAALDRAEASDRAVTGNRIAQLFTGQGKRAEQNRAARSAARIQAAEAQIAALKSMIAAERSSQSDAHARETKGVADRHTGENRQLDRALEARIVADRVAEVQVRRDEVRQLERERQHGRDQDTDTGRER